jgi:D-aspartate ligase
VVLGVEHPRGVAVIRSLGQRGIPVVAVERDRTARGLHSRYLRRAVLVDDSPARTVSALESLGREDGGVLIPTNDHFLMIVSQHFERLAPWFSITVPPWDVLRPVMDKPACYHLGREAGLTTPRFFVPRTAAELDQVVSTLDFTAHRYILSVTLPGTTPADPSTGRLTRAAGPGPESLRESWADTVARTGEFPMIAEVIPGRSDQCVGVTMVVNREHAPVLAYCVRRLQLHLYSLDRSFIHPYELGANVYCESVRDDEAVQAAARFVRRAGFYGAITVEFRRDVRDGQLTLIKADPRVVRATSLSSALGQDVPAALYDAFTTGASGGPRPYPEGVAWIWPSWYLETVWRARKRAPMARQLWALVRHGDRVRSFAYLSLRDPLPAVVDALRAVRNWLRAGAWAAVSACLPSGSVGRRLARRLLRARRASG